MPQSMSQRQVMIAIVASLAIVLGGFGTWRLASAQYYTDLFVEAPYQDLAGIEEAVQRRYTGPSSNYVHIFASIARFDSAEHAALGLEAINAYVLAAFASDPSPIAFEPVDTATSVPGALTYAGVLDLGPDTPPYGEGTLIQAQDHVYVYTVAVVDYYGDGSEDVPDEVSLEAAVAMFEALVVTPAGLATPAADAMPATSGLWAKFPVHDDDVPQHYGITGIADDVILAPPVPATPEPAGGYYGVEAGLVTVAGRQYEQPPADEGGDASAPALSAAFVEVAAFDGDESAAVGFSTIRDNLVAEIEAQSPALEGVGLEVEADEVAGYTAQVENEGEQFTIVLIIARSGPYISIVGVGGANEDEVLGLAVDLAHAVIDAEAGDGEAEWSSDGASTGGIWDKFPLPGDEVLRGLAPWDDQEIYP